jgi:uncharacterized protein
MSQANIEVVRQVYAAFARQDLAGVFAAFDPAVELTQSREVPWGGEYRGVEGARTFFAKLTQTVQSHVETERFIDAGDQVVQVGHTRGVIRATGGAFDVPEVHVWTLRAGKIIRFQAYIDNSKMLAAFER